MNLADIQKRVLAGGKTFDPDAIAFFNAAGITNATQKTAIDYLVVGLKNAGIWTKMKAVYPFVGGTANTHKFNLKNPQDSNAAFRLIFNGGWTHTSGGALPNGTNGWANTFLAPSSNLSLNSTHLSFYTSTNVTTGLRVDIGSNDTGNLPIYLSAYYSTLGVISNINNTGFQGGVATANSRGLVLSSRTANNVWAIYKNWVNIANRTTVANLLTSQNVILSALTSTTEFSNRIQAFSSIGDGLNATEASNLYTVVQQYQTLLGRQV